MLADRDIRRDWRLDEVMALFDRPLNDLLFEAQSVHRRHYMPRSVVRLSAGQTELSGEAQALCFLAGAGSIFCGDQLLTTPNPSFDTDMAMLGDLGLERQAVPRGSAEASSPPADEVCP